MSVKQKRTFVTMQQKVRVLERVDEGESVISFLLYLVLAYVYIINY